MTLNECYQNWQKQWIFCLLLVYSAAVASAAENSIGKNNNSIRLLITHDKGSELQLEVRKAPLSDVLNEIMIKTGIQIHYSVLPNELITATCIGPTLKNLLECLFDSKADLVFRYQDSASGNTSQRKPEEIWVLGTDFGSAHNQSAQCVQAVIPETASIPMQLDSAVPEQSKSETTGKLLEMAKAKDPADRANAISRLGMEGEADNDDIRRTLAFALSDHNAEVRAQAVNSLARREGESAGKELQEALLDSDSSVRLMVVDNAGNNTALLQQALTDSDETVRTYAAMKLAELSK